MLANLNPKLRMLFSFELIDSIEVLVESSLLSTYYMAGTETDTGDIVVNDKHCPPGFMVQWGR